MRVLSGKAAERAVDEAGGPGIAAGRRLNPRCGGSFGVFARTAIKRWSAMPHCGTAFTKAKPLRVLAEEIEQAWKATPCGTRDALKRAAANIRRFANWQIRARGARKISGGELGQVVRPLRSVGCYVPGGRYPLPSTLLMTAIPAQVAGVERIVVVTPNPQPATLAAAYLLGISEVYRCGGAQAIAALAYGTESIARVDKIVGPGNAYVTAAKKLVSFDCAIDMLAGPTEAVIYSESGNAEFLASDLVAQAEHDPDAVVVFISTSSDAGKSGGGKRTARGEGQPHRQKSDYDAMPMRWWRRRASRRMEWVNRIAPEHLTVDEDSTSGGVQCRIGVCRRLLAAICRRLRGRPEPRAAHSGSGALSRRIERGRLREGHHGAEVLPRGLREIAPVVTTLAETEGLRAHAQSVRVRCGDA